MKALSVLIVEDDAMIGMLLAEMLGDMGYNVCAIAATEEDAVAKAAQLKPGLLIVDGQLREGSGASAVDQIMQAGPIPCVFISGASAAPDRPDAHVLRKPFLEEDLIRAIRDVVDRSNAPAAHPPASPHIVIGHRT